MPKLIFIFLDGVGIGSASQTNPFFVADAEYLPFYKDGLVLPDQTPIKPIDATLDTAGMPMSATGQTSLFTGVNMPRIFGRHKDSYPDQTMRKVIKENNIFSHLKKNRLNVQFLNAYPGSSRLYTPEHVRILDNGQFYFSPAFKQQARNTLSVTTCMVVASFMRPFGEKDIQKEKAIFHEYSNRELIAGGFKLPVFSPETAAGIIYN
ncbi:MAG: hypothetical protein GY950_04125, partial [bacterium]|nr:hypothetical protein [bacterium]